MRKRIENMTKDEILKEFEGGEVIAKVSRRDQKLVPLTMRVSPALVKELGKVARERGIAGHTTMARMLLEEAVSKPKEKLAEDIANRVVKKLGKRRLAKAQ